ncbi:MAG TPA: NAD(P)-binding domain-containing protein [Gemmatimonadaceae bacterium]|nr:NAD(P)-binding domain-containing protein [Gemmatimonadaceae bacterium]
MRIGVLGTGVVGQMLGGKLVAVGHEVRLGARSTTNQKAADWARGVGARASHGTFAEAARFGEVLLNCTAGSNSLEALASAGADNLADRILIDVANPLDFSRGMPPTLTVCNTDSLGEQIQRAFPATRVVKALNTVNAAVMIEPSSVAGAHDLFICGNDAEAKRAVTAWLREWFGWQIVHDVGDITAARGTEMILPIWIRLMLTLGTPRFNFHIQR